MLVFVRPRVRLMCAASPQWSQREVKHLYKLMQHAEARKGASACYRKTSCEADVSEWALFMRSAAAEVEVAPRKFFLQCH